MSNTAAATAAYSKNLDTYHLLVRWFGEPVQQRNAAWPYWMRRDTDERQRPMKCANLVELPSIFCGRNVQLARTLGQLIAVVMNSSAASSAPNAHNSVRAQNFSAQRYMELPHSDISVEILGVNEERGALHQCEHCRRYHDGTRSTHVRFVQAPQGDNNMSFTYQGRSMSLEDIIAEADDASFAPMGSRLLNRLARCCIRMMVHALSWSYAGDIMKYIGSGTLQFSVRVFEVFSQPMTRNVRVAVRIDMKMQGLWSDGNTIVLRPNIDAAIADTIVFNRPSSPPPQLQPQPQPQQFSNSGYDDDDANGASSSISSPWESPRHLKEESETKHKTKALQRMSHMLHELSLDDRIIGGGGGDGDGDNYYAEDSENGTLEEMFSDVDEGDVAHRVEEYGDVDDGVPYDDGYVATSNEDSRSIVANNVPAAAAAAVVVSEATAFVGVHTPTVPRKRKTALIGRSRSSSVSQQQKQQDVTSVLPVPMPRKPHLALEPMNTAAPQLPAPLQAPAQKQRVFVPASSRNGVDSVRDTIIIQRRPTQVPTSALDDALSPELLSIGAGGSFSPPPPSPSSERSAVSTSTGSSQATSPTSSTSPSPPPSGQAPTPFVAAAAARHVSKPVTVQRSLSATAATTKRLTPTLGAAAAAGQTAIQLPPPPSTPPSFPSPSMSPASSPSPSARNSTTSTVDDSSIYF